MLLAFKPASSGLNFWRVNRSELLGGSNSGEGGVLMSKIANDLRQANEIPRKASAYFA